MNCRQLFARGLCALTLGCFGATQAQAELVTYTFTGEVSLVDAGIASEFSVGEAVTGTYTFESTTPDSDGSANIGSYLNAVTAFSANIGGDYPITLDNSSEIRVRNNNPNDSYSVDITDPMAATVNGLDLSLFSIFVSDPDATVFASDALPVTLPELSEFETVLNVSFFTDGGSAPLEELNFRLTLLQEIPEPSSVALAAFTLTGLALTVRQRKL